MPRETKSPRDGETPDAARSGHSVRALEARIRELEADVARSSEAAQRAEQVRDHCISVLSHDLRGPIGTILTWAHLLRGGQLSAEKTAQALGAIERSARGQVRLLEQVVDLARLRSGRLSIEPQAAELGAIAQAAIDETRAAAETKRIALVLDRDGAIGVAADPERLRQAIVHLLDNAIRAEPEGGRIDVTTARHGDVAEVHVRDHGPGLEPGMGEALIAEAHRPAPASRGRRGLGLPLAVGLAELHGGSLELASEGLDRGTVARVRMPASRPARG